jgi:hypothetical protein
LCAFCFGTSRAEEIKAMPQEPLLSMLAAVNKIRSARIIPLDCDEYLYRYLGYSDRLRHYSEILEKQGLSRTVVKHRDKFFIAYQIAYGFLKQVPQSRFGRHDDLVIQFTVARDDEEGRIEECKMVLKAAPILP